MSQARASVAGLVLSGLAGGPAGRLPVAVQLSDTDLGHYAIVGMIVGGVLALVSLVGLWATRKRPHR